MASSNDPNDASDIFWPGYVDAISNLAINLLFVIAVMAIVVIGTTMQINELNKRKDPVLADDMSLSINDGKEKLQVSSKGTLISNANLESQEENINVADRDNVANDGAKKYTAGKTDQQVFVPESKPMTAAPTSAELEKSKELQKSKAQNRPSEAIFNSTGNKQEGSTKELQAQLAALQLQLKSAMSQLNEAKAALVRVQTASGETTKRNDAIKGSEAEYSRSEMADKSQIKTPEAVGSGVALAVNGGVVVPFEPSALEITPAFAPSIIEKMSIFANVKSNKWRITVFVPNGFSEAKRMGFYRANAVRNLLLKNGVRGENLEIKIQETSDPSADNTRVIIRPVK